MIQKWTTRDMSFSASQSSVCTNAPGFLSILYSDYNTTWRKLIHYLQISVALKVQAIIMSLTRLNSVKIKRKLLVFSKSKICSNKQYLQTQYFIFISFIIIYNIVICCVAVVYWKFRCYLLISCNKLHSLVCMYICWRIRKKKRDAFFHSYSYKYKPRKKYQKLFAWSYDIIYLNIEQARC